MKELRIAPTKTSPEIILNPDGIVKIRGRSIHENVTDFFAPVEDWISSYILMPAEVTCVDLNLEYFNSASANKYTTDNAAMIGITGYYKYLRGEFSGQDVTPLARL